MAWSCLKGVVRFFFLGGMAHAMIPKKNTQVVDLLRGCRLAWSSGNANGLHSLSFFGRFFPSIEMTTVAAFTVS
jgi:hypothetical protein